MKVRWLLKPGTSHRQRYNHSQACSNKQETPEETRKWVINLSDQPLTEKQEKLLDQGPKFVIKPKRPPVEEYITAIEKVCTKLEQGPAEELRVEVKKVLKKHKMPINHLPILPRKSLMPYKN